MMGCVTHRVTDSLSGSGFDVLRMCRKRGTKTPQGTKAWLLCVCWGQAGCGAMHMGWCVWDVCVGCVGWCEGWCVGGV